MLKQVLREIESSSEPLDVAELSRRLGVDRSALEGMIEFWVQKGRLASDAVRASAGYPDCSAMGCRSSCTGLDECPFMIKMPRSYTVR